MDVGAILDIITKGGMVGILVFILWSGIKKVWVFGWYFEESLAQQKRLIIERDEWRELALRGTTLAEKAVIVAQKDSR